MRVRESTLIGALLCVLLAAGCAQTPHGRYFQSEEALVGVERVAVQLRAAGVYDATTNLEYVTPALVLGRVVVDAARPTAAVEAREDGAVAVRWVFPTLAEARARVQSWRLDPGYAAIDSEYAAWLETRVRGQALALLGQPSFDGDDTLALVGAVFEAVSGVRRVLAAQGVAEGGPSWR